jgi:flagellar motor switch protein FliM
VEKILSQAEIDALFRRAREQRAGAPSRLPAPKYSRCDFRQAGQISKDQSRSVSALQDIFAANVSNSLGAYLRVGFEVNLVSVEQLVFVEFVSRLPDMTYLASLAISPLDATALIQLDLSLAFPIIDIVLGGMGKEEPETRAITEIEEQILEGIVRVICRELQSTWSTILNLEFAFDRRELPTQVVGLMLSSEKVLSLSFEIRMPEARGMLNLAFPAVVSNALLRKLATQWTHSKATSSSPGTRERLRERLLDAHFPVELNLPPSPVRIEELLKLKPGSVLQLKHRVADPVRLAVSGKNMFLASPVSCGTQRGAQVVAIVPLAQNTLRD